MQHFREYPLLNTPHLFVVLLKAASHGAVTVADCARRVLTLLAATGEHLPVPVAELGARLDRLRGYLAEARLITALPEGGFTVTARGREALRQWPSGFDTADLMEYQEFAAYIRALAEPRRRLEPKATAYDQGFAAYRSGQRPTQNPNPADSADHQSWEHGWFEALDEDPGPAGPPPSTVQH